MRIARLSYTPIKGAALSHPGELWIGPQGAEGDREFFLATAEDKLLTIERTGAFVGVRAEFAADPARLALFQGERPLHSGPVEAGERVEVNFYGQRDVAGHVVPGPWSDLFSELAGQPLRLVRAERRGTGVDVAPVTLLGRASVDRLELELGEPVDSRRFRMLIELETAEPNVEDSWAGFMLTGDEIRLRVGGPVPRCAAVTRHPDAGDRDLPVVRAIKGYRGLQELADGKGVPFGVYADVVSPGTVRVGESLTIADGP